MLELGGIRERDLDIALAAALHGVTAVRDRLFVPAGIVADGHVLEEIRVSAFSDAGETDVLMIVRLPSGARCALMIEHKIDAAFQPEQALRYRLRGARGLASDGWAQFATILIAPAAIADLQPPDDWDVCLKLEDLAGWAEGIPDTQARFLALVYGEAVRKFVRMAREYDEAATIFWTNYRRTALAELPPGSEISRLPERVGRFAPWPRFHLPEGSQLRQLEHKSAQGVVDLTFPDAEPDEVGAMVGPLLPAGARVVRAGRSTAIRLSVQRLEPLQAFNAQIEAVRAAVAAVIRLHEVDRGIDG